MSHFGRKTAGPVAQLVERGAYRFVYTYCNAEVAGSNPAWTKEFSDTLKVTITPI